MILFLLVPFLSYAHVVQDDVHTVDKAAFSFSTVCSKLVAHSSPLIEIASGTQLDCMSKKVEVADFCEKEFAADPYFIRAYIDKENKKVICQSGKKVIFRYQCVKLADRHLCQGSPKEICRTIQKKLARRLDLVHASHVKSDKGVPQLNCFFDTLPLNSSLNL